MSYVEEFINLAIYLYYFSCKKFHFKHYKTNKTIYPLWKCVIVCVYGRGSQFSDFFHVCVFAPKTSILYVI